MWVVFTHHLTNDLSTLDRLGCRTDAHFVHHIDDAAVDGLHTITHVRQRAVNNDRHRIAQEVILHHVLDGAYLHTARVALVGHGGWGGWLVIFWLHCVFLVHRLDIKLL